MMQKSCHGCLRKWPQQWMICENESSGAYKCSLCDHFVHASCGSYREDSEGFGLKVTCNLCVRKNWINIEQEGAKSGQKQQAEKMVSLSNSRLPAVDIGTNVVVRVPDLNRGRLVPRNVPAVVDYVNSSGLYLLGTKEGLLERLYARNEFTTADNNFIEAHDVLSSSLSLWLASMITSGSEQGFVSCHCKRYCIANVIWKIWSVILSVILTAPAKINELCHCS